MNTTNIQTTAWTRADALKIKFDDPTTTQPIFNYPFPIMDESLFIWDTMPLRKLDGTVVSVNGWSVIFTLTAIRQPEKWIGKDGHYDITSDWENRHSRARMCFWYSKDGQDWKFGGRVMAEGVSPTACEWAGSPILLNEEGDIDLYYTCVSPNSTIAKVRGRIVTSEHGVRLQDFDEVIPLFTADGYYYQTEGQNKFWSFRDPWPFIDPNDGKLYILFEGNVGGERGCHVVTDEDKGIIPPRYEQIGGSHYQTGCIGIAVAQDKEGLDWKLLPPLVTAVGVNDQTERPHYVFKDGHYYLFTISHSFTFADGLSGPDGVYGFISDKVEGPYQPLNGSGLVLGNPSSRPFQTYSHYVMPNGLVTSFIDSVPNPDLGNNEGEYRIGGTEAPTVEINIEGYRTFVVKDHGYGFIPPMENTVLKACKCK